MLSGGKYNTGTAATFAEGDWNEDGLFNQLDIVAALQSGNYLTGAALSKSQVDARDLLFALLE